MSTAKPSGDRDAWIERVRRDVADAGEVDWQARAEAAEAKVARVKSCTEEWQLLVGDDPEALADAILAIIGSEEAR